MTISRLAELKRKERHTDIELSVLGMEGIDRNTAERAATKLNYYKTLDALVHDLMSFPNSAYTWESLENFIRRYNK